jgi:hypothetical protein
MTRVFLLVALSLFAVQPVAAQYGQKKSSFQFAGDSLVRYEWTLKVPTPDGTIDENRYIVQARPRVEVTLGPVALGVGGQFNYSKDDNTKLPDGTPLPIVRDNFYSRKALADLYYARVKAGPVVAEGGRMMMPFLLTEMIWDDDLRPQGGMLALVFGEGGSARFALRGIYTLKNHWFPDDSKMFGGSAEIGFETGQNSQIVLSGSYLDFQDLDGLDPQIRRQNTRNLLGFLANDYRVADVQARLVNTGQVPFHIAIDYCWNTALSEGNKGLWFEVTMGALAESRVRLAYTYAKIDRDATVAAFNADDFFWGTGYQAHRIDIGGATSQKSSIHGIASRQRFKDSPILEEQDQWIQRYRIEYRYEF